MTTAGGDYLDFELSIDAQGDGSYMIATRSAAGDGRAVVRFEFDRASMLQVVHSAHAALRGAGATPDATREVRRSETAPQDADAYLKELGGTLFRSVMTGKVGQRYRSCYDKAMDRKTGLRLRLRIQAPEIAALPWEYLYDPDQELFISRTPRASIVRYVEVEQPPDSLNVSFPIRILGVVAGPSDQAALDKDAERARIQTALADLVEAGQVELSWTDGGTFSDFAAALQGFEPHVVHFIGHGDFDESRDEGVVLFEQEDGTSNAVSGGSLGDLLLGHPTVRLLVLNSCEGATASGDRLFSSTAATVVRRGVPAVIAMQFPITDGAAIQFSHELYRELASSEPVDRAVATARMQMHAAASRSPEWGTPVLFLQSATGRLFDTGMHKVDDLAIASTGRRTALPRAVWQALGGAAVAIAAAGAWLAGTTAPVAPFTADLLTSEVTFRLDSAAHLGDDVETSWLTASAFSSYDIPPSDSGFDVLRSQRVAGLILTGNLQVELSDLELPAGIAATISADADEYRLAARGRVPAIAVTLEGEVRSRAAGRNDVAWYGTPSRARFIAQSSPDDSMAWGEVSFRVPRDSGVALGQVPVRTLSLFSVTRQFGQGAPIVREEPALAGGYLRTGGDSVPLERGRDLRMSLVRGRIDGAVLAGGLVRLRFSGLANRLGDGASYSPSLMPSRLGALSVPARIAWLVGAGALGALIAAAAGRLLRPRLS